VRIFGIFVFNLVISNILECGCRLKEKGLQFSDPPTEAEIEAARQATEKKKDMEGIDTSNIIVDKKRRQSGDPQDMETLKPSKKSSSGSGKESGSSGKSSGDKSTTEAQSAVVKEEKSKKNYLQEDEEAQF
jgi:hypothetical protein